MYIPESVLVMILIMILMLSFRSAKDLLVFSLMIVPTVIVLGVLDSLGLGIVGIPIALVVGPLLSFVLFGIFQLFWGLFLGIIEGLGSLIKVLRKHIVLFSLYVGVIVIASVCINEWRAGDLSDWSTGLTVRLNGKDYLVYDAIKFVDSDRVLNKWETELCQSIYTGTVDTDELKIEQLTYHGCIEN